MGVLAGLVVSAQPALLGGGAHASATEGSSWMWEFVLDGYNLSAVAGTCKVLADDLITEIITLDFDGDADGSFTLTADERDTDGLAIKPVPRQCRWYLRLDDGTDVVQVWDAFHSPFVILPAGA